MKSPLRLSLTAALLFAISLGTSCSLESGASSSATTAPAAPHSGGIAQTAGDAATTVNDFKADVHNAIQAFADYNAGNVDLTWSLANVAKLYQSITTTSSDVKQLVQDAVGNAAGAEKLASDLASSFSSTKAPPETKTSVIADLATAVAAGG